MQGSNNSTSNAAIKSITLATALSSIRNTTLESTNRHKSGNKTDLPSHHNETRAQATMYNEVAHQKQRNNFYQPRIERQQSSSRANFSKSYANNTKGGNESTDATPYLQRQTQYKQSNVPFVTSQQKVNETVTQDKLWNVNKMSKTLNFNPNQSYNEESFKEKQPSLSGVSGYDVFTYSQKVPYNMVSAQLAYGERDSSNRTMPVIRQLYDPNNPNATIKVVVRSANGSGAIEQKYIEAFVNANNKVYGDNFKVEFVVDQNVTELGGSRAVIGYRISLSRGTGSNTSFAYTSRTFPSASVAIGSKKEPLPSNPTEPKAVSRDLQLRYIGHPDRDGHDSLEWYYTHETGHTAEGAHPFEQTNDLKKDNDYRRQETIMAYVGDNAYPIPDFGPVDCEYFGQVFGYSRDSGSDASPNIAKLTPGTATSFCVPPGSPVIVQVDPAECDWKYFKRCNLQLGDALDRKTGKVDRTKYASVQNLLGAVNGIVTTNGNIIKFIDKEGNVLEPVENAPTSMFMSLDRFGGKIVVAGMAIIPVIIAGIASGLVGRYLKKKKSQSRVSPQPDTNTDSSVLELGEVDIDLDSHRVTDLRSYSPQEAISIDREISNARVATISEIIDQERSSPRAESSMSTGESHDKRTRHNKSNISPVNNYLDNSLENYEGANSVLSKKERRKQNKKSKKDWRNNYEDQQAESVRSSSL